MILKKKIIFTVTKLINTNILKDKIMEFKNKVDAILYKMAYEFEMEHASGCTETAHKKGLKRIGQVYEMAEQSKNEKYIDITTGKTVQYGGW